MSQDIRKIIGICQIQNEDVFIGQVLKNIVDFCDVVLVADHLSTDRTAEIVTRLSHDYTNIQYFKIKHPSEAHDMVRVYANTATWVFPVDGDELYDPFALSRLKKQLFRGEFDEYRQIYGHSMHCVSIDINNHTAKGYMSPPCRTVTKLYNFNAIVDWVGPCSEKCLGGSIIFKPGYSGQSNLRIIDQFDWNESPFRLLHACFVKRSSKDKLLDDTKSIGGRLNPYEIHVSTIFEKIKISLKKNLKFNAPSLYKKEMYMRGPVVEMDISEFLI